LKSLAASVRVEAGSGRFDVTAAETAAMAGLRDRGWAPDYITLRYQHDLSPVTAVGSQPLVVLGAARLGKTRLIDNLVV
jgi:pantoate--beta-alanine ligase